jgi:glucoside 3-dehydrogenase (cytochrome c) catalytic subunit
MNSSANQSKQVYDVLIVGSGASGGWAAKRLAEAGLKVAVVEAGRPQSAKNFTEHKPKFDLKYRSMAPEVLRKTRPIQARQSSLSEFNYEWYVNDNDEPYTTPADKPYGWLGRTRMVGGRTNVWGRVSLRYSDLDFKAASRDGHGEDWPLSYQDVAPYYDLVERYVGVTGMAEGLDQLPDGQFLPAMPLTCQETLLRNRVKQRLGRTVTLARSANLTKPQNGRGPCHYCGPCERGCMTHSYFNSSFTTMVDAIHSGNCTLVTDAMVHKVLMDTDTGRARGLLYVDRNTKQEQEIYGRVVILCAQAQESVRILLNSETPQHPGGLANSSGVLGHYFASHAAMAGASGEFPAMGSTPSMGGPERPLGIYIARFRNLKGQPASKNFLRGYGYEGESTTDFNWRASGYGEGYKKALREPEVRLSMTGYVEMLPRWDNFVEIDRDVKDAYGIPVIKIHLSNGENEEAMMKDIDASAIEMLEAAGAKNILPRKRPAIPYWAAHEACMARMGSNPKTSILNQFQQAHDVKNLFVMDASSFTSNPCQNPTLTIMALSVRSCDYLMGALKKGEV